jgi:hypothetical protein
MKLPLEVNRRTVAGHSWIEVTHAPVDDEGGHTSYMLLAGEREGEVSAFPESNYRMTTPEHRNVVAALLEAEGLRIA